MQIWQAIEEHTNANGAVQLRLDNNLQSQGRLQTALKF